MLLQTNPEMLYLALTAGLTAILWIPYIVDRIAEHGLWPALRNPIPDEPPKAAWAHRLMCAHRNAIENLAVFATLVCVLSIVGAGTETTAVAAMIFFYMRLAHVVIYTLGIPLLRTLVFFTGFLCQVVILLSLF